MTYVVWVFNGTDGWSRSDDLKALDEVLDYIAHDTMGSPYLVTKVVEVSLIEKPKPTAMIGPGVIAPNVFGQGGVA